MLDGINFPDVLYDHHLKEINGVKFTPREIEIIAFILNGRSGKKTASFLSISQKTVENHTRNIMGKLGCNSRESIIDFVEKSGKFLFTKQYYLSFLIHTEFEEIVKRLGFFNEKLTCSIVYWASQEDGYAFLPYLKAHLKLADVRVTCDNRQKWQSLSDLLSESSHAGYKLYLLPTLIFEEFQSPQYHKPIINHKSPLSKLFILPARKAPEELPIELKGYDSLDLTQHKNYYFLLFEILKRLFRKHPLEGTIVGFQDRIAALLSSTDPQRKSFHPCEKNMPPKKLPFKFTIQEGTVNLT
jgi:DNA-binding CsgD family transcriptional regulator